MFACDRSAWSRCLAWHAGYLPALSLRKMQLSWAAAVVDSVDAALENALVAYPQDPASAWRPGWDPEDIADLSDDMPAHPKIWTDGSREEDVDALVGSLELVPLVGRSLGFLTVGLGDTPQDPDLVDCASRIFPMVLGNSRYVQHPVDPRQTASLKEQYAG